MIPYPPKDAAILGLFQAYMIHSCSMGLNDGLRGFFGIRTSPFSVFAKCADHISSHVYSGLLSPERLISEHSLQPYFGAFATTADELRWISRMRSGQVSDWMLPGVPGGELSGRFCSVSLRCCAGCIESDYNRFGMPYWRVSHQFTPLKHCLEHHTALFERCGACGRHFCDQDVWHLLPGDPCQDCGSHALASRRVPTSLGYSDLVTMFTKLRSGASSMRPEKWQRFLQAARKALARRGYRPPELKQRFMQYWECESPSQLMEHLEGGFTDQFFPALLKNEDLTPHPNVIVSTGEFLARLLELPSPWNLDDGEGGQIQEELLDAPLWASAVSKVGEATSRAYVQHAMAIGLSDRVALSLASGKNASSIAKDGIASRRRIEAYVKVLKENGLPWQHLPKPKWPDRTPGHRHVQKSHEKERALMRDRLLLFIDKGPARRTEFARFCSATSAWLRKNDPDWFSLMLPPAMGHRRLRAR